MPTKMITTANTVGVFPRLAAWTCDHNPIATSQWFIPYTANPMSGCQKMSARARPSVTMNRSRGRHRPPLMSRHAIPAGGDERKRDVRPSQVPHVDER